MDNNQIKNGEKLYSRIKNCCGCGTCSYVCPQGAIRMVPDKFGFLYPQIDVNKCINCRKCINICSFRKPIKNTIGTCYAAVNKDIQQRHNAASGGIFGAVASRFLKAGHVVAGVEMTFCDGISDVHHTVISTADRLIGLQGSKYVQSKFWTCLSTIEKELKSGNKVLISGTPCQINAARSLLCRYENNIYTMDLICHGVPSEVFFNSYLQYLQKKDRSKINSFSFRDKQFGWGLTGKVQYIVDGKRKEISLNCDESSYYKLFLDGEIYRSSCYSCPYASKDRIGDVTIGDYWGVDKYSPELLSENGGRFDVKSGVSCVLVNSEKGKEILDLVTDSLELEKIDLSKVLILNTQLREPAKHTSARDKVFKAYLKEGYGTVEKSFQRHLFKNKVVRIIKKIIKKIVPQRLINIIKGRTQ